MNEQLKGADDCMLMQMELEPIFTQCERHYFNVIHYEDFHSKPVSDNYIRVNTLMKIYLKKV